ncbi:hypothetical protein E2C01_010153 [Portunus trituberculatus]|uniref:Uncharacterized protein n=1 Tax=Portunus trituberculatus TaxID=210409 RepID=A0A5B7D7R9_PORTR|nr:hypothetical protein [Portunus trituberculatus]
MLGHISCLPQPPSWVLRSVSQVPDRDKHVCSTHTKHHST